MSEQRAQASRRGLYLIGAALLVVFGIAVVAGAIFILTTDDPDSEDTFEPEQDEPAQPGCWFTPGEETVTAYESSDTSTSVQELDGDLQYAIREVENDALGLELRDGTRVWVNMEAGTAVGECEAFNLPPNIFNAAD